MYKKKNCITGIYVYEINKRKSIACYKINSLIRAGFCPEWKMFLTEVADGNDDNSSKALAKERPPAKYLYKYLEDKIVECKIKYKW